MSSSLTTNIVDDSFPMYAVSPELEEFAKKEKSLESVSAETLKSDAFLEFIITQKYSSKQFSLVFVF